MFAKNQALENEHLKKYKELALDLGISAKGLPILKQALTHPAYFEGAKPADEGDNQRLEFLGDAVLDMLVGALLYKFYPDAHEGELTKMRAAVVCESYLAKKSEALGINNALLLGKGSEAGGDRSRPSVLADAFEAVLGAIYVSEGIVQAENFVKNQFEDDLHHLSKEDYEDKKSLLQELIQKSNLGNIAYRLLRSSGPDHAKIFVSGVYCGKILLAEGQGNSKKESEQEAAKAALLTMDQWKPFLEEEKLLSSHKQKCNLNCKDCQQEKEKVNKISLKSKSKNRKNRKKINEHGNNLLISYDLNNHNAKKKNKKQEFANISTTRPNKNYFYDEMANKAAMVNENVKD